jgi:translation initiation factor IF-1
MLSHGKLFMESFDLLIANQNMNIHAENVIQQTAENNSLTVDCEKMDLRIGEISKSAKRARICGN